MVKKSLQSWHNSNDITYSQKEIIKKFGVGDYYPEHELKDFRKIYYWNDILERNVGKLENSFDINSELIKQMNFFSTWWNNNLILIIDGKENSYWVKLIVYEMPCKKNGETKMREIFEVFFIEWVCPGALCEAKNKAKEVEGKLRSDNPILGGTIASKLSVSYYDDYNSGVFPVLYGSWGGEKIKRIELRGSDFYAAKNNPDDYFKPLDIVKIFIHSRHNSNREGTRHTGIYLGNRKVCHLFVVDRATKKFEIMIEDWNELFEVFMEPDKINKMIRYHPAIPFKHKDKIIEHIAKSITKIDGYYSRQSKTPSTSFEHDTRYNKYDNNCEHMVNKCVLGLNFSDYAEKLSEKSTGKKPDDELNISEKHKETNGEFDRKYSYKGNISEIRGYGERSFDVMRDGVNMHDACIEVQPKTSIFKDMLREYLNR